MSPKFSLIPSSRMGELICFYSRYHSAMMVYGVINGRITSWMVPGTYDGDDVTDDGA